MKIDCKGIRHTQLDPNRINQVLTVEHSVARDCLEVELLITCVLVQDEQILVLVESAEDEALVELADHSEFVEVAFSKHLTQFIVYD